MLTQANGPNLMNETWIAFAAGVGWLAAFTAALFALSSYVQRRDKRNRGEVDEQVSCQIPLPKDEFSALETLAKARGLSTTECAQLAVGIGLRHMQDGIVLSEKGARQLIESIENPKPPSPRYVAAKERHARMKAKGQRLTPRAKR